LRRRQREYVTSQHIGSFPFGCQQRRDRLSVLLGYETRVVAEAGRFTTPLECYIQLCNGCNSLQLRPRRGDVFGSGRRERALFRRIGSGRRSRTNAREGRWSKTQAAITAAPFRFCAPPNGDEHKPWPQTLNSVDKIDIICVLGGGMAPDVHGCLQHELAPLLHPKDLR
jgi:hypothetical protein